MTRQIEVKLLVGRTDGSNRGDVIAVPEAEFPAMLAAEQIDPEFVGRVIEAGAVVKESLTAAARPKRERAVARPRTEKATG